MSWKNMPGTIKPPLSRYSFSMAIYIEYITTILTLVVVVVLAAAIYYWRSHHGIY